MAQSLTEDGDILIYACDFAATENGQTTMQLLAQYTAADVSASMDTTGDPSLSGDWDLEVTIGDIEAQTIVPADWAYSLNLPARPVAAPAAAETPDSPALATFRLEPVPAAAPALPTPLPTAATASFTAQAGRDGAALADTLGVVRMLTLEDAFRQTLSPFMASLSGTTDGALAAADPLWVAPSIAIDTDHTTPVSWQPTADLLDDSLVHEALVNEELPEATEVDALALPREHAAPGFAAQLARWSQWGSQRPLTRAAARA
jgi:Domain of unknown function (DUF4347)